MTSTPRILALLAAGALTLALSACATNTAPEPAASEDSVAILVTPTACEGDSGVTMTVDASALSDEAPQSWCYRTAETVSVADALTTIGVETEGTEQYGDQVVCRVNGLPSASEPVGSAEDPSYVESCKTMPAAFAYWSLWVKPADGAWDYAQEGLSSLTAEPGDSVELLFVLDGAPAAPAA